MSDSQIYEDFTVRQGINFLVNSGNLSADSNNAVISASTSGNNTLVAAVTGKQIVVHSLFLVATGAVTVAFQSAASGTALTGTMSLAANGVLSLPYNPNGWFKTISGQLLNLVLGGAVQVSGALTYSEL